MNKPNGFHIYGMSQEDNLYLLSNSYGSIVSSLFVMEGETLTVVGEKNKQTKNSKDHFI